MSDIEEEAPIVKVKGRRQAKMTEKKVKTKKSCWLVTVSTNMRYADDDEGLQNDELCLSDSVEGILNNIHDYVKFQTADHGWSKSFVKVADNDYVIERGGKTKALHCHMLIRIQHYSNIRLDYDKIKQTIKDDLGLDNVYINAKLVRPTSEEWLEEYIDKMR